MAGWVEKATRFTNPDAWVDTTKRLASPKPSSMFVNFSIDGTPMLAPRILVPTVPSMRKPVNVARPAVALIALVPVKVVLASRVMV
jgi:hypothetical protein